MAHRPILTSSSRQGVSCRSLRYVCSSPEDLPLRIKVTSVHPSLGKQHLICVDATLDVYLMKSTEAAILSSSHDKQYFLPLNSSTKFSPVYNPENDLQKALCGYQFSSIKHIIKTRPRPVTLYAKSGFLYGEGESCMEAGDVYIVKDSSKNVLVLEDVSNSAVKVLQSFHDCDLTTDPSVLSLYPSDFFAHLKLPAQVMLSDSLKSERIFTVSELVTVDSVLASVQDHHTLIELCLDSPIEVESVHLSQDETYSLTYQSLIHHGNFTPDKPLFTLFNEEKYCNDNLQKSLLSCRNNKELGYTLQVPKKKPKDPVTPNTAPCGVYQHSLPVLYESQNRSLSLKNADGCTHIIPVENKAYEYATNWMLSPTEVFVTTDNACSSSKESANYTLEEGTNHSDVTSLTSQNVLKETTIDMNKRIIENYNSDDVAELLDNLGIGEYKETFKSEAICGRLLMLLDDDILLHELGMSKKLHRMKLLQIINGKRPIIDVKKYHLFTSVTSQSS